MSTSTGWMLGALCAREGLRDLPWTVENTSTLDRARMGRVCASCPVLAACAVAVATVPTTAGFWAGRDRNAWPEEDTLPGLEVVGRAA